MLALSLLGLGIIAVGSLPFDLDGDDEDEPYFEEAESLENRGDTLLQGIHAYRDQRGHYPKDLRELEQVLGADSRDHWEYEVNQDGTILLQYQDAYGLVLFRGENGWAWRCGDMDLASGALQDR